MASFKFPVHFFLYHTLCEQTPREYDKLYENKSIQLGYTPGLVRGLSYDAVWALALALNKTQEMFLSNYNVTEIGCDELDGGLVPLEQFNYSNGVMGCVIRWNLEQTNFSGVSVRQQTCSLWQINLSTALVNGTMPPSLHSCITVAVMCHQQN